MRITVREATPDDATALQRLNAAFNGEGLPDAEMIRAALSCNPQEFTCIAECDGVAVGFLCAQVHFSWCYEKPTVEIAELYVDAAYRRQGAARQLMQLAEKIAMQRFGATKTVLLTGGHNLTAQTFYESQGYCRDDEIHYAKRLSPAPVHTLNS
ncbi:MAG: GNAT family N-acetyltransferase [Clostridia bacterium]|nr:GNAT family N-acetyltransferase [Clostridia bacterium]